MSPRPITFLTIAITCLCFAPGCRRTTVVSGEVTYGGKSVRCGSIVFVPGDGQGPTCGGRITDGRFCVETQPGKKIVQITGVKSLAVVRNYEELQQGTMASLIPPTELSSRDWDGEIPNNAEGNNVEVQVQPGRQTIDFLLKQSIVNQQKNGLQ